jgi:hypothetical protein
MGKYQSGVKHQEPQARGPQPIWRGIGCLLIVLVPILAYAAADLSLPFFREQGLVPRQLLATPQTPDWLRIAPVVAQTYQTLFGRPGVLATLLLTFIYILFIGGIMSVFYAFIYRLSAPSRYGPLDAPTIRTKVKKYKR